MGCSGSREQSVPTTPSMVEVVDTSRCTTGTSSGDWCHWPPLSRQPLVRGHTISLGAVVEPRRGVATAAKVPTAPPLHALCDVVAPPTVRAHHSPLP